MKDLRPLPPVISARKYPLWRRLLYWLMGWRLPVVIELKPRAGVAKSDEDYEVEIFEGNRLRRKLTVR